MSSSRLDPFIAAWLSAKKERVVAQAKEARLYDLALHCAKPPEKLRQATVADLVPDRIVWYWTPGEMPEYLWEYVDDAQETLYIVKRHMVWGRVYVEDEED